VYFVDPEGSPFHLSNIAYFRETTSGRQVRALRAIHNSPSPSRAPFTEIVTAPRPAPVYPNSIVYCVLG